MLSPLPPSVQTQAQLRSIGQQVTPFSKPETAVAYNTILDECLSSDQLQSTLEPTAKEFTNTMLGCARRTLDMKLAGSLLTSTLQTLATGIPGSAGVAVSKIVREAASTGMFHADDCADAYLAAVHGIAQGDSSCAQIAKKADLDVKNSWRENPAGSLAAAKAGVEALAGQEDWLVSNVSVAAHPVFFPQRPPKA